MSKTRIRTPLGALCAHVRNDPVYPGIDICLERNGQQIMLAWVEIDRCGTEPIAKMRLYADCKDDEPTDDRAISSDDLDEYFASLASGGMELV